MSAAATRGASFRSSLTGPLARLVAAGAVLFLGSRALDAWRAPAADVPAGTTAARGVPVREPIVLSAPAVRALERGFVARHGRPPEPAERRALLGEAAQDEMLYREARVLQLGLDDASIRRRLLELLRTLGEPRRERDDDALVADAIRLGLDDDVVVRRLLMEKMRLVLQRDAGVAPLGDAELAEALERNRARLVQPETVTIEQVFLSGDRRGDGAERDARRLLSRLRAGALDADGAAAQGDALPLADGLRAQPRLRLQARFGKEFADAVFALDTGTWSGPISSPFGVHLVRVVERRPDHVPTVDEARAALVEIVRHDRAHANLARGLARLRELYEVRIADAATSGGEAVTIASRDAR